MDAECFVIMPATPGWNIYHGACHQNWYSRWDEAAVAADIMAAAHHDTAGVLTAVILEVAGNESALISIYGDTRLQPQVLSNAHVHSAVGGNAGPLTDIWNKQPARRQVSQR
jgi:hypothetical protein